MTSTTIHSTGVWPRDSSDRRSHKRFEDFGRTFALHAAAKAEPQSQGPKAPTAVPNGKPATPPAPTAKPAPTGYGVAPEHPLKGLKPDEDPLPRILELLDAKGKTAQFQAPAKPVRRDAVLVSRYVGSFILTPEVV